MLDVAKRRALKRTGGDGRLKITAPCADQLGQSLRFFLESVDDSEANW